MPVKVSVIVPCYNVAQFIPQCMNCLRRQTLQDIEIICIDDRSTDGTLDALREYEKTDPRIRVIAAPINAGVAAARNMGLCAARGQYVGFLDPDDLVDDNFFDALYTLAHSTKADIAKGNVRHIKTDGEMEILNENADIRACKYNFDKSFWSAIYRRAMLQKHDIRFPDGFLIAEDLTFLMKAVHFANSIATTDDVFYWYYRREGSADSNALSTPKMDSGIRAVQHMIEWTDAQPDTTPIERHHTVCHAYNIAAYLANKQLQTFDVDKLLDLFIWLGHAADAAKCGMRPRVLRAMQRGDRHALRALLFTKNTRLRLFGLIPMIKRARILGWGTRYLLCDVIPLLTIIPGKHKTKIYVFGVLALTIKR